MRRTELVAATTLILLVTMGGTVSAQEVSPAPRVSPTPEQLAAAEERLATATCLGQPATIVAIAGFETVGTPGADVIVGTDGDDIIRGEGGNDRICAGPGADVVEGGAGKDRISGGIGDDTLDGGAGNDTIDGGKGADLVTGAAGNDRLSGAAGDDTLDGGQGKDVCIGGKGIDRLPACNEKRATRGTLNIRKNTTLKGPHKGNIVIWESGVTLDCDGHTVQGKGRKNQRIQAGIGIHVAPDPSRVTVVNCHPTDFYTGLQAGGGTSKRLTIRHSSADGNGAGFVISAGVKVAVVGSSATGNDSWGFILAPGTRGSKLVDNVAEDNALIGFGLNNATKNTLRNNVSRRSGTNYDLGPPAGSHGNVFIGNLAEGGERGFAIDGARSNIFRNNIARGGSDGAGFEVGGASRGNVFTGNTSTGNAGDGFSIGGRKNTLIGNAADENAFVGFTDTSVPGVNNYEDNTCQGNGQQGSQPDGLCDDTIPAGPESSPQPSDSLATTDSPTAGE